MGVDDVAAGGAGAGVEGIGVEGDGGGRAAAWKTRGRDSLRACVSRG